MSVDSRVLRRDRCLRPSIAVLAIFLLSQSQAELIYTATSPVIQDGFLISPPITCPVAQDGYTSNTFPWTHNPTCIDAILPDHHDAVPPVQKTICAYTNRHYNGGRGISVVASPEVAASITNEAFGNAIGGLEEQIGEQLGMWNVQDTEGKGKGVFLKKDVAAAFAGESLIFQTPVLLASKDIFAVPSESHKGLLMNTAVDNLPARTQRVIRSLDVSTGTSMEKVVENNGIAVKWPWVDEIPELFAVVPEVARINHACRPNALWRFDDYTMSFEVFALREIKPGEEVTLSYDFETRPYRRRMRSIQENFGFTCSCSLCSADSATIEASNDRLSEIKAIKSALPKDEQDTPQLLSLLPSLISQLEEEGLFKDLPMYEEMLAYTWSGFGIEDRARYWAGRAREHWAVLAGRHSWEKRRCAELEENVKGHPTWMSWEGDPWDDVGKGHPWREEENHADHHHDHE